MSSKIAKFLKRKFLIHCYTVPQEKFIEELKSGVVPRPAIVGPVVGVFGLISVNHFLEGTLSNLIIEIRSVDAGEALCIYEADQQLLQGLLT